MGHTDTPRSIHPKILSLCSELVPGGTPVWVPVKPPPGSAQQNCFPNVERQIASYGGRARTGWQIWEWPGIYLEAEYHSIWESGNGELIDVTPKDKPTKRILFLEDPSRPYGGGRIRNEMRPLRPFQPIVDFISACDEMAKIVDAGHRAFTEEVELSLLELETYGKLEIKKANAAQQISLLPEPNKKDPCWCGCDRKYQSCHLGQR